MCGMRKMLPNFAAILMVFAFVCTSLLVNAQSATPKPNLSKGFIENKGQIVDQQNNANPQVLYLLNNEGMNVQLRKTGFSYDSYTRDSLTYRFHRVDVELLNCNPQAKIQSEEAFNNYFNY